MLGGWVLAVESCSLPISPLLGSVWSFWLPIHLRNQPALDSISVSLNVRDQIFFVPVVGACLPPFPNASHPWSKQFV